jgi:hypothetical protein
MEGENWPELPLGSHWGNNTLSLSSSISWLLRNTPANMGSILNIVIFSVGVTLLAFIYNGCFPCRDGGYFTCLLGSPVLSHCRKLSHYNFYHLLWYSCWDWLPRKLYSLFKQLSQITPPTHLCYSLTSDLSKRITQDIGIMMKFT